MPTLFRSESREPWTPLAWFVGLVALVAWAIVSALDLWEPGQ